MFIDIVCLIYVWEINFVNITMTANSDIFGHYTDTVFLIPVIRNLVTYSIQVFSYIRCLATIYQILLFFSKF